MAGLLARGCIYRYFFLSVAQFPLCRNVACTALPDGCVLYFPEVSILDSRRARTASRFEAGAQRAGLEPYPPHQPTTRRRAVAAVLRGSRPFERTDSRGYRRRVLRRYVADSESSILFS